MGNEVAAFSELEERLLALADGAEEEGAHGVSDGFVPAADGGKNYGESAGAAAGMPPAPAVVVLARGRKDMFDGLQAARVHKKVRVRARTPICEDAPVVPTASFAQECCLVLYDVRHCTLPA